MTAVLPLLLDAPGADVAFLIGRVLFGAVLAFTGLNHFLDLDAMSGYAEMKGIPAPRLSVAFSGGMLMFGGLGVALGVFPVIAAGALAVFLLVTTPVMHDFWAVPEDQAQQEMTQFLKNVALLGGALVLLVLGGADWAYSLGIGL
ncbi:DoxX family protein [Natranaeroarchaeum aerophilus]|uniref:DoxX family protein n=1 Tax=Natranaeroarchaeum aerophilus TaxID=2917711 RepID=A0AAE3K610_9EURY|nr:DoxX family protein [Natranaeroarchaeum aerophilus]MCL9813910.1 DoxX family protein [Natranaeroarchaeum aerophilus]